MRGPRGAGWDQRPSLGGPAAATALEQAKPQLRLASVIFPEPATGRWPQQQRGSHKRVCRREQPGCRRPPEFPAHLAPNGSQAAAPPSPQERSLGLLGTIQNQ